MTTLGGLLLYLVEAGESSLRFVTSQTQHAAAACSDPTFIVTAAVSGILGNHAWERWLRLLRRLRRRPEQITIDKTEFDRLSLNAAHSADAIESLTVENACLVRLLADLQLAPPQSGNANANPVRLKEANGREAQLMLFSATNP